jgi:hypothetical protein
MTAFSTRIRLGTLIGALVAIFAPLATAQAKNLAVTISGNLSGPSPGQCSNGYPNQCSGDNATACEQFIITEAPKVTGSIGKGHATSMCVTLDPGNNVNAPNNLDSKSTCSPIYGQLSTDTGAKPNCFGCDVFTNFNFAGVLCSQQGNPAVGMFQGGYGLEGSNTDNAETGWGTLTGTLNNSTGAFSLSLKGTSTP